MTLNPALLRSHCSVELLEGLDVAQAVYRGNYDVSDNGKYGLFFTAY